jgi:ABC-type protease/lipase transport system fused ATPase/permease subunit
MSRSQAAQAIPRLGEETVLPLRFVGRTFWPVYLWAIVLSGGVNLLLLAPTLYVMQILDRVLVSRSVETLLMLTLIVAAALLAYGGLDWARGMLMQRAAHWLETRLGSAAVRAALDRQIAGTPVGAQGLRDIQALKVFLSGRGVLAFFDAPWGVMFIGALWLLHPWLGAFSLASVLLLVAIAAAGEVLTSSLQRRAHEQQIAIQRWCDAIAGNGETITALGMRGAVLARFAGEEGAASVASGQAASRLEAVGAASRTLRQIMQVTIMGVSAWLALQGDLTAGGVVASSILLYRALAPFDQLVAGWRHVVATCRSRSAH